LRSSRECSGTPRASSNHPSKLGDYRLHLYRLSPEGPGTFTYFLTCASQTHIPLKLVTPTFASSLHMDPTASAAPAASLAAPPAAACWSCLVHGPLPLSRFRSCASHLVWLPVVLWPLIDQMLLKHSTTSNAKCHSRGVASSNELLATRSSPLFSFGSLTDVPRASDGDLMASTEGVRVRCSSFRHSSCHSSIPLSPSPTLHLLVHSTTLRTTKQTYFPIDAAPKVISDQRISPLIPHAAPFSCGITSHTTSALTVAVALDSSLSRTPRALRRAPHSPRSLPLPAA
jgi:hypothetical protein